MAAKDLCRVCGVPLLAIFALAQQPLQPNVVLNLPFGPAKRLPSPDNSYVLYGVDAGSPQLWIENTRTRQRTMLLSMGGTLSAGWSPDGAAFYVNDHRASDSMLSYVYTASTLKRLDLATDILTADSAARFSNAHVYFEVDRWEGAQNVAVHLYGHTDESPVVCFDFRYRVSLAGIVQRLAQRVSPITERLCKG